MKRYLLAVIFLICFLFAGSVNAQQPTEYISTFKSNIVVNDDATIDIVEEISYILPDGKRGIFWQLPISYEVFGFKRTTGFKLNELYYYPANNPSLKKSMYEQSTSMGWVELKIGDPDEYISGEYVYVIDYTLRDVGISFFEDHDEVYLNVIGPGWQVPIYESYANISIPAEAKDIVCYTGPEGSTASNCTTVVEGKDIMLSSDTVLNPYEALTIAIALPVGTIENNQWRLIAQLIIANLGILIPIPVGIFLFTKLKKKWKNKPITIIPHYEAPDDLDPLMGGYIYKAKYDQKHLSATIIWMAIKGLLVVEKDDKKTYLKKVKEDADSYPKYISDMFDSLFKTDGDVDLKKIPTTFIQKIHTIISTVTTKAKEIGYMDKSRVTAMSTLTTLGSVIGFTTFFVLMPIFISYAAIGTAIGILISCVIMFIVGSRIDIRGDKGNELYYELEGLKMYINTAEKHRIEFHNDPEKFRGVFEQLLPYAIVFGLEKKWVEEFKDLYEDYTPNWYRGDVNMFNAYLITQSISNLNSGIKTATTKTYGSSSGYRSSGWSSGGSGFSGGSSGGGGGGSGGGSW